MAPRRSVAILVAVVTALPFSGSAGASFLGATGGADHCCTARCPWDRPQNEPQEPCAEEAAPATIAHRTALRTPLVRAAVSNGSHGQRHSARPGLARTALMGSLDRTLLRQRTSLLH